MPPDPIGSMYAIYGDIYHQYTPFMLPYIPYMDPMGMCDSLQIHSIVNSGSLIRPVPRFQTTLIQR